MGGRHESNHDLAAWASLIACGQKKFETRGWAISYRGPIAIHAAAIKPEKAFRDLFPLSSIFGSQDYRSKRKLLFEMAKAFGGETPIPVADVEDYLAGLPTGSVIATATLIGCHKIDRIREMDCAPWETGCWDCNSPGTWIDPTAQELLFGNWQSGRYAWELVNVQEITPVSAGGRQGLWNWES